MYNYQRNGFSLIELLVVITIVGVLAAIAVPMYRSYSASAKVNQSFRVVESLMNKAIVFASQHGTFGDAYDLGLSTNVFSRTTVPLSAYGIMPNIRDSGGFLNFLIYDGGCGKNGGIMVNLDPQKLGLSPENLGNYLNAIFILQCYYWNNSGTISKYCGYSYTRGGSSLTVPGDFIPGLENINLGTNNDQTNLNENVFDSDSFINATCQ